MSNLCTKPADQSQSHETVSITTLQIHDVTTILPSQHLQPHTKPMPTTLTCRLPPRSKLPGLPSDDPPETPKPKKKHRGTEDLPNWFNEKIKGCRMQTFISQVLVKSKLWPTVQNENESKKMKQWPAVQNDRNLGVCSICERGCRCTALPHYWTFGNTQKRRKSKKCKLCVSCKASQCRVLLKVSEEILLQIISFARCWVSGSDGWDEGSLRVIGIFKDFHWKLLKTFHIPQNHFLSK